MVDLTELIGFGENTCISSFIMQTRSSQSLHSALHDLAWGELNTCGTIRVQKHTIGDDGTFQFDTDIVDGNMDTGPDFSLTTCGDWSGVQEYGSLVPATYHVAELAPTRFELESGYCTKNGDCYVVQSGRAV